MAATQAATSGGKKAPRPARGRTILGETPVSPEVTPREEADEASITTERPPKAGRVARRPQALSAVGRNADAPDVAAPTPAMEETPPLSGEPLGSTFPELKADARGNASPSGETPFRPCEPPASPPGGNGAAVTLRHLAAELAERRGVAKAEAEAIAADLVDLIADHLKRGDRLRIAGLGVLEPQRLGARTGRNPATGEAIQIAASTRIAFRPTKGLRQAA